MTNQVNLHWKDLDRGEVWVIKHVIDVKVDTEGSLLGVEGSGLDFGKVDATHVCLCRMEIT